MALHLLRQWATPLLHYRTGTQLASFGSASRSTAAVFTPRTTGFLPKDLMRSQLPHLNYQSANLSTVAQRTSPISSSIPFRASSKLEFGPTYMRKMNFTNSTIPPHTTAMRSFSRTTPMEKGRQQLPPSMRSARVGRARARASRTKSTATAKQSRANSPALSKPTTTLARLKEAGVEPKKSLLDLDSTGFGGPKRPTSLLAKTTDLWFQMSKADPKSKQATSLRSSVIQNHQRFLRTQRKKSDQRPRKPPGQKREIATSARPSGGEKGSGGAPECNKVNFAKLLDYHMPPGPQSRMREVSDLVLDAPFLGSHWTTFR
ncbi:hypothetical protein CF326_g7551 [Tilletia indica]|nr:hypothetical protein CF326_g7551 [Tilletia indica]